MFESPIFLYLTGPGIWLILFMHIFLNSRNFIYNQGFAVAAHDGQHIQAALAERLPVKFISFRDGQLLPAVGADEGLRY